MSVYFAVENVYLFLFHVWDFGNSKLWQCQERQMCRWRVFGFTAYFIISSTINSFFFVWVNKMKQQSVRETPKDFPVWIEIWENRRDLRPIETFTGNRQIGYYMKQLMNTHTHTHVHTHKHRCTCICTHANPHTNLTCATPSSTSVLMAHAHIQPHSGNVFF